MDVSQYISWQYLPWVVGGLLLLATVFFFVQFIFPSWRLHKELATAIQKIGEIKQRLGGHLLLTLRK